MADIKPLKLSQDGSVARLKTGDTIPIEHGGTGATTLAAATNNLLPSQTNNQGKFLTTDGSTVAWGTVPSGSVSVGLIDSLNNTSGELANISMLRFDTDSGFDLTDLGGGAVKVGMKSTFKFIQVDGQGTLTAVGLDTLKIVAGENVAITTNNAVSPQTLTISATMPAAATGSAGAPGGTIADVAGTAPSSPAIGQLWYDTGANALKIYLSGGWTTV